MMERNELEKLPEAELRALAAEKGVHGTTREELIAALSDHSSGTRRLVERAKEAVTHAAHKVEDLVHHKTQTPPQPPSARPPRMPSRGTFDVPSSTVHPHADELETLMMARRYLAESQPARALEILEKLAQLDPDDENVMAALEEAQKRLPQQQPPPPERPRAPEEPMFMLDLEELPDTYGVDDCEVLYKDPWWVFAYWEVTDGGIDAARAQLGPSAGSARLVLRLFTTIEKDGQLHREVHDVDLHGHHGRRYLPSVKPGAHLRVAVGLLSQEGYFAPIAHSSLQRIPYAEAAPPGPVEWMEVVPARTRGREREPIVIVRRKEGEHRERGLAEEGDWEELGVHPPGPGSSEGVPFGRRKPAPPGSSGGPFGSSRGPTGEKK